MVKHFSCSYLRHWLSFLTGGSISLYVYLYAIYYFFARTKMYGFFQTTFYFGYTAVICFGLMTMCGTIGYMSASAFVRKIYSTVKID
jgi:transmembrane 9 superfamily protein 3